MKINYQFLKLLICSALVAGLSHSAYAQQTENTTEKLKKLQQPGDPEAGSRLIDKIDGVYKTRFKIRFVDGSQSEVEDILEIVRVAKSTFYFTLNLNFYNGHTCGVSGLARYKKNNSFLFVDKAHAGINQKCFLQFTPTSKNIAIHDIGFQCRLYYCGANAGLDDTQFPMSERRKIHYMKVLTNSEEYKTAVRGVK